ncbi:MAG: toll/interleukin-1 receptor domain-containing protein [Tidjanibacter sp.]|nr:toll/interleukin-1 receptor domain-containing protein [Tidjanibacter sp.]
MANDKKRVFISYSRKDYVTESGAHIEGSIVQQVKDLLQASGISYWFDEEGIYTGAEFMGLIAKAIEEADVFLFISTENSNSSQWVQKELACANELGKWLVPVKAVEKYPASISIWLAGKDHLDYYHNPESIAKLGEIIRHKLDEIDSEAVKLELNNEIAEEKRLKEEEKQLKIALGQYAIYLEKLEAELTELKAQQERLAIDIALRQKSIELLKIDQEKIDKKYQVITEKLSTPKESSNGSNVEFAAPEVDMAEVKVEEPKVKTREEVVAPTPDTPAPAPTEQPTTTTQSEAPAPEPAPTPAPAPKRTAQEEINALMSMMSILHPKKQEEETPATSETPTSSDN